MISGYIIYRVSSFIVPRLYNFDKSYNLCISNKHTQSKPNDDEIMNLKIWSNLWYLLKRVSYL